MNVKSACYRQSVKITPVSKSALMSMVGVWILPQNLSEVTIAICQVSTVERVEWQIAPTGKQQKFKW